MPEGLPGVCAVVNTTPGAGRVGWIVRAYLGQAWRRKASESDEAPFRDELLGAQRLDDRALALAARFTINPRARAKNILPRFEDNARVLRNAYRTLASDVRAGRFLTSGAEWLLDNFHLVAVADRGRASQPAADLLPAAAAARLARAPRARPRLRHGDRAGAPQRRPVRAASNSKRS